MLVQPRHDLDEIAGPRAVIELRRQNAVPAVAAGTGRARQAEDEGRIGDARGGAALHRGGADLAWLSMWKAMENPSIRFSNSGSIASGVTSRPVKPVPPVVMMASTPSSAIHRLMMTRIASTSSTMISRAASL